MEEEEQVKVKEEVVEEEKKEKEEEEDEDKDEKCTAWLTVSMIHLQFFICYLFICPIISIS